MKHSAILSTGVPVRIRFCAGRRTGAFSLIELLVVIAIIVILAAILFPVFATLQENAREGNTMSHLHDISAGMALYKLDNKSYPPVLFAYACDSNATAVDNCNMNDTMQSIGTDANASNELIGLYPEYVRDWHTFTCDDDLDNDPSGAKYTTSAAAYPQPNYLTKNFTLQAADGVTKVDGKLIYPFRSFFTADAVDINPEVAGDKQLVGSPNNYTFIIRYQTNWTSFCNGYDPANLTTAPCDANYPRQLRWANPPGNTFVTAVTDHIPNANKLIILYENGTAQKEELTDSPTGIPTNGAWVEPATANITPVADPNACNPAGNELTTACNYSGAIFWQYTKGQ